MPGLRNVLGALSDFAFRSLVLIISFISCSIILFPNVEKKGMQRKRIKRASETCIEDNCTCSAHNNTAHVNKRRMRSVKVFGPVIFHSLGTRIGLSLASAHLQREELFFYGGKFPSLDTCEKC